MLKRIVLSVCAAVAAAVVARAETYTWTGGSGDWATLESWQVGEAQGPATRLPGLDDDVVARLRHNARRRRQRLVRAPVRGNRGISRTLPVERPALRHNCRGNRRAHRQHNPFHCQVFSFRIKRRAKLHYSPNLRHGRN